MNSLHLVSLVILDVLLTSVTLILLITRFQDARVVYKVILDLLVIFVGL